MPRRRKPKLHLDQFDPDVIAAWRITASELAAVERYVTALQGGLAHTALDDVAIGGVYGTSALLHEVVELRRLLSRDPDLLSRSRSEIVRAFHVHPEAHLAGLTEEYLYLQRKVHERFGVWCNIGALVKANTPEEWNPLFDTDLPFTYPTPEEIQQAEEWMERLKRGHDESQV